MNTYMCACRKKTTSPLTGGHFTPFTPLPHKFLKLAGCLLFVLPKGTLNYHQFGFEGHRRFTFPLSTSHLAKHLSHWMCQHASARPTIHSCLANPLLFLCGRPSYSQGVRDHLLAGPARNQKKPRNAEKKVTETHPPPPPPPSPPTPSPIRSWEPRRALGLASVRHWASFS